MTEKQTEENKKYFDPDFDTMITRKQSHQALMTRITYEVNRRHRMEAPPAHRLRPGRLSASTHEGGKTC